MHPALMRSYDACHCDRRGPISAFINQCVNPPKQQDAHIYGARRIGGAHDPHTFAPSCLPIYVGCGLLLTAPKIGAQNPHAPWAQGR